MKGYYTVKLVGGDFTGSERIALEAKFASAFEACFGGPQAATALVLQAGDNPDVLASIRAACADAEASVWAGNPVREAKFHLQAFTALDL